MYNYTTSPRFRFCYNDFVVLYVLMGRIPKVEQPVHILQGMKSEQSNI